MSRWINAEWLEENAKQYSLGYYDYDEWATPLNVLDSAPSIDIVHCGECRYGEYRADYDDYECNASGCGLVYDAEFYCADGERKESE